MPVSRLRWIIVAAAVLPFLAGVAGPFVLDDHVNLAPVWQWLAGHRDAWSTIFENQSGPAGRPLAYLSLMANAAISADAIGFKAVNLALHAATAVLVFELLRRLLDATGTPHARLAPLALAIAWAVHPMQVSTVLYVVQRMAILGAMAQLLAVLAYLEARRLQTIDAARARRWLFLAFPALMLAGLGAKETIVVAPLLCLAVEVALPRMGRTPRELIVFFVVFLVLPAIAAVFWALATGKLDNGYLGREFSLAQRLWTQPRVLFEYAAQWLWPANFGLYRDGYLASGRGAASLAAIAAWLALAGVALCARARWPLFALGVLWFLAAHSLEAGPFALEMYFEHRNYLASLGLLLALYGLLPQRFAATAMRPLLVFAVLLAVLGAWRAWQWNDIDRLLANEGPPAGEVSRRLQIDRAIRALERGDADARAQALAILSTGSRGDRAAAAIWETIFACDTAKSVPDELTQRVRSTPPAVLTHNHLSWLAIIARRAADGRCEGLSRPAAHALVDAWATGARQPLSWRARTRLPVLHAQIEGVP